MPLVSLNDRKQPILLDAAWARGLLLTHYAWPCFMIFVSLLNSLLIAVFIATSQLPLLTAVVPVLLVFGALFFSAHALSPFAFLWFLKRPEIRHYLHDVLCAVERHTDFDLSYKTDAIATKMLRHAGIHTPSAAIALELQNVVFWRREFRVLAHVFIVHPQTNAQHQRRVFYDHPINTAQLSWLSRKLCRLSLLSHHVHDATLIFPLDGAFTGSAHERLHLVSSLDEAKKTVLAGGPDTARPAPQPV